MLWPNLLRQKEPAMNSGVESECALASDLELARQVQMSLLPPPSCCVGTWQFAFSYQPAAAVGGDYIDLIPIESGGFYFALGDVSGKGIAASMLMSHLHATLRALISADLEIEQIVKIASRNFCQSSMPAQFATLVIGKADQSGNVELVNAGHTPVLLTDGRKVTTIEAANLPVGVFCATDFVPVSLQVLPGNLLLAFSDGINESTDNEANEYGIHRLVECLQTGSKLLPSEVVKAVSESVARFTGNARLADDRTILALGR